MELRWANTTFPSAAVTRDQQLNQLASRAYRITSPAA